MICCQRPFVTITYVSKRKIQSKVYASTTYELLPALIGSAIAYSSTYPLDTYKTRIQIADNSINTNQVNKRNLFQGYREGLCLCMTTATIYFCLYGNIQTIIGSDKYMIASMLSSFIATFIKVPGKVLTKLLQNEIYDCLSSAIRGVHQTFGVRGFFKGLVPYLIDDVPETAIKFYLYSFFSFIFPENTGLTGLITGIISAIITQPLDVLQTHFMCHMKKTKINITKINFFSGTYLSLIINVIQTTLFYQVYHLSLNHLPLN